MTDRTCKCLCQVYGPSSKLNLPGSALFRSIFLLEELDKFFKPSVLFGNPTLVSDVSLRLHLLPSIQKKTYNVFLKTVLRPQVLVLAPTIFPYCLKKRYLKTCFLDRYCEKNHLNHYNFCQQYKDHFAIDKAKGFNWIFFQTLFWETSLTFASRNISVSSKLRVWLPSFKTNLRFFFVKV